MKLLNKDLDDAVSAGILSTEQSERLKKFLQSRHSSSPSFDFTNILYYLGGLIAIGALTIFMNLGWERFGGWGIFLIAVGYSIVGLFLSRFFQRRQLPIPAGICATFVVALAPLAIYGLQVANGWWPGDDAYQEYYRYVRWHWIFLELGTLAVGVALLWVYRYPFMVMPVAVALWFLSMDAAVMLMTDGYDWEFRAFVSIWFGLATILIAFWVDIRSHRSGDFAFWLYIFGVIAFWGGLTSQDSNSEFDKFLYFCTNIGLILVGAVLSRRVFIVFGALGGSIYLGHLADSVFEDSWLFPISLTAIGLAIVYGGLVWNRHQQAVTDYLRQFLPEPLRELLDSRR